MGKSLHIHSHEFEVRVTSLAVGLALRKTAVLILDSVLNDARHCRRRWKPGILCWELCYTALGRLLTGFFKQTSRQMFGTCPSLPTSITASLP
jgi:hypothetical protein